MAQAQKEMDIPMSLDIDRAVANRMADLQWQINFTQIKLNRWKNAENADWGKLKAMNKAARAELKDISTVFHAP